MGFFSIFDKKKKHNDYVELMRQTAATYMPEIADFDMTLVQGSQETMEWLKNSIKRDSKYLAKRAAKQLLTGRKTIGGGDFSHIHVFISCFKGDDIYFFDIGYSTNRKSMTINDDFVFHFNKKDIQNVSIKRKKVTLEIEDDTPFMFTTGVHAGTVYALPEEDKRFHSFLENLK